jgi:hypothetical protein
MQRRDQKLFYPFVIKTGWRNLWEDLDVEGYGITKSWISLVIWYLRLECGPESSDTG